MGSFCEEMRNLMKEIGNGAIKQIPEVLHYNPAAERCLWWRFFLSNSRLQKILNHVVGHMNKYLNSHEFFNFQATIIGVIRSVDVSSIKVNYLVEDSTGCMSCVHWIDAEVRGDVLTKYYKCSNCCRVSPYFSFTIECPLLILSTVYNYIFTVVVPSISVYPTKVYKVQCIPYSKQRAAITSALLGPPLYKASMIVNIIYYLFNNLRK